MRTPAKLICKVAAPLAILAPAILAEETEAPITGDLDALEVSDEAPEKPVSSFRTDTPLLDTPTSASVVTSEQIQEQAFDSITDIVDYTPGVTASQGEGHRDAVSFRGQPRSTADFYVDGIRDDVQYYRPLYNVDQVEILRGPNALLFGRGGTGGIINRVLKKAETGSDFGSVLGRVNSFGGAYGQFDYNKSITDDVAFRLNFFYEHSRNHRDLFDGDQFGINPTLRWDISDDTSVDFAYEYIDQERFIDRGIPANGSSAYMPGAEKPATFLSGVTYGDSELNETTLEAHTFRTTVNHRFSDTWKARLTGFYGTYDKKYQNYFSSDYNPLTNQTQIDGYVDSTDRQTFTLAGDVIGEFSTGSVGHKLLAGAEYVHTSSDQNRFNNVWSNNGSDKLFFDASSFYMSNGYARDAAGTAAIGSFPVTALNDDTRVTIDSYSFLLQDEIAITDQFDLILGARFDSFDIEVVDAKNGGPARSQTDEEISPRVGIVYKPTHCSSIYASYSESFLPRSGEQFSSLPTDTLDPDEFSNLEVGFKWDILNDLSLTLAAFQIDQSSAQEVGAGTGIYVDVDTETLGFEAQLQGRITDCWSVLAGYTYLDGEIVSIFGGSTGQTPREQPEHSFSVWNMFRVTEKFGLGLGAICQSESYADNGNSTLLPGYVRVDAAAYYNVSETLRVQLNVENVLDTDYYPSAHNANNITVGAPINAALSVTKTF